MKHVEEEVAEFFAFCFGSFAGFTIGGIGFFDCPGNALLDLIIDLGMDGIGDGDILLITEIMERIRKLSKDFRKINEITLSRNETSKCECGKQLKCIYL